MKLKLKQILFLATIFAFGEIGFLSAQEESSDMKKGHLIPMRYHYPGATDFLAVVLWSWPVPCDFDHDGDTDLIVSREDTPYNGTYLFENPGPADNPFPVFKKGRRLSHGEINVQASWIDGKLHVLTPNKEYPNFGETGLNDPVLIDINPNPHYNDVRGNMWKYVDYNGDGLTDIAIGSDDWTPYGHETGWDPNGTWLFDSILGMVYIRLNDRTNELPHYAKPFAVSNVNGEKVESYGWPSPNFVDFDDDGDLDLLCGDFRDRFIYFENLGTRTEPIYSEERPILDGDGDRLTVELEMAPPVVFDWNKDALPDIICGDEDGRIACFINSGTFFGFGEWKTPLFQKRVYFRQEADLIKFGSLVSPYVIDFDGDGDQDIVAGSAAGFIAFIENLSGPGVEFPTFAEPVRLKCRTGDGTEETFRIIAGPKGSIQGSCEEKWGYLTFNVADWNDDGFLDIVMNNIWGRVLWLENLGSKKNSIFAPAKPVIVDWEGEQPKLEWGWLKSENVGKTMIRAHAVTPPADETNLDPAGILTQWRTTPLVYDFNNDGLLDLAIVNVDGDLTFYERYKKEDGSFGLKAPQMRFKDDEGNFLKLAPGIAGGCGRRKIAVGDYDGDGKFDLIANTMSGNIDFYRQVETSDESWGGQRIRQIGDKILEGHSAHPAFCDFNNDGIPDLVVGGEDGHFYYMRNNIGK